MSHRNRLWATLALGAALAPSAVRALPLDQQTLLDNYDAETQAALNAELAACTGCQLQQLSDGSPNVIVPPDAHPQATGSTAPSPTATTPAAATSCATSSATVSRNADYYRALGNAWFGVYYRTASRSSTAPYLTTDRQYHGDTENAAGVTVFGYNLDVARAESSADARVSGYRRVAGRLLARNRYAQMITIGDRSTTTGGLVSLPAIGTTQTFWQGSYGFTLGPVPVTISGSVTGSAGHLVAASTSASTAYVVGTPSAGLYARGSISASIGVAAIGVDGQITLVEGRLPNTAAMSLYGTNYTHDLQSDIELTLLRGSIDAWVRVGFWRFKKTWRRNLVRMPGYSYTQTLYSAHGSTPICSRLTFGDTLGGGLLSP
jgi:hypothetical protein